MQLITANINFLSQKQGEYRKKMRRLLIIQMGAFGILALYIIGMTGAFGYYLYLSRANKVLESQAVQLSSRIQEFSPVETKFIFIKTKVSSLVPVLAAQRRHQEIVEAVLSLIPEGISIRGFNVSEEGEISFAVQAATFQSLRQFLSNLRKKDLTPYVRMEFAKAGSVSLGDEGGYSLSVSLALTTD